MDEQSSGEPSTKQIYVHPDNLSRGRFYRVVFTGCVPKRERHGGSAILEEFVIDARYEKMMVAVDDSPAHNKKVLAVVFRVKKEQYARVISWYRITGLTELAD